MRAGLGHRKRSRVRSLGAERLTDLDPEADDCEHDAEEDADQDEDRPGAREVVDDETDDQATDHATDQESSEVEQVTTAQSGARRRSAAVMVHSPAPFVWSSRAERDVEASSLPPVTVSEQPTRTEILVGLATLPQAIREADDHDPGTRARDPEGRWWRAVVMMAAVLTRRGCDPGLKVLVKTSTKSRQDHDRE